MKKTSKIFTNITLVLMVGILSVQIFINTEADVEGLESHLIKYIVYNEKGEAVEEGLIPKDKNGRYSLPSSIRLDNGWSTAFSKPDSNGVYSTKNIKIQN